MNVLVTGGAGFVGSYVVRELLASGRTVVVYDSSINANALDLILPERPTGDQFVLVTGRITDGWELLRAATEHEVTHIVHLASPLTQAVNENPSAGIEDICGGTANVFEIARTLRLARVVWASSVAVFGTTAQYPPGPLPNDAAHHPMSLYGSCKSLCETMALTYREHYDVDSIGLRLTVVYGMGRLRGYMRFPSDIVRRVALGESVAIPFGDQPMNWQYVEDVSSMIVSALEADAHTDLVFNTYGDARTFREAAAILSELVPDAQIAVEDGMFSDAGGPGDFPAQFDDAALRAQTGFRPAFPLEQGIAASLDGYRRLIQLDQLDTVARPAGQ